MPSLNVRLSEDLHSALVAAAAASGRSLQREVVMRLEGRVSGWLGAGEDVAVAAAPVAEGDAGSALPVSRRERPAPAPSPRVSGDRRGFRPDFKGGSK